MPPTKRMGNTWRFFDGDLATFCKPHHPWGRVNYGGKVHFVDRAIIRWNRMPRLSFLTVCGRQVHQGAMLLAEEPTIETGCKTCRKAARRQGLLPDPHHRGDLCA